MKTILPKNNLFINVLGQQTIKQTEYMLAAYCVTVSCEDGLLLYNNLSKELILLSKDEEKEYKTNSNNSEIINYLKQNWFLVPDGTNCTLLCDQLLSMAKMMAANKKDKYKTFTIMTTLDCNARCFYCFQKDKPHPKMDIKTAKNVADYILKKSDSDKEISLRWFGGEPLFNVEVINYICNILKTENRKFKSSIVTNGYLFDLENINSALNLWNLKKVQITLDGTEEVYNRCKNYIYKGDLSPFKIVIENIKNLLINKIKVNIRLNIGLHNAEDLYKLVDYLYYTFNDDKNLYVYAHQLFNYDDDGNQIYKKEDIIKKNALFADFEKYLKTKGFFKREKLENNYNLNHCMADSDESILITPDGCLSKCEHFSDDQLIGDIYKNDLNQQLISEWKQKQEKQDICNDCAYYVDCVRLKKCPNNFSKCDQKNRENKINTLKERILITYKEFLKNSLS